MRYMTLHHCTPQPRATHTPPIVPNLLYVPVRLHSFRDEIPAANDSTVLPRQQHSALLVPAPAPYFLRPLRDPRPSPEDADGPGKSRTPPHPFSYRGVVA